MPLPRHVELTSFRVMSVASADECSPDLHAIGGFDGLTCLSPNPNSAFLRVRSLLHLSLPPSYISLSPSLLHLSLSLPPTSFFNQHSTTCFPNLPHLNCIILPFLLHFFTTAGQNQAGNMAEYDTVPPEADAKQNALEQPGVAERTDDEKDAPQKPLEDRKDPISSSEDGSSGSDSSPPYYDCPDVGCTWPCAHHVHRLKEVGTAFWWYPALKNLRSYHPEIPKVQSEMKVGRKDCQFCRIFFTIGQSDCACGANAQNDHIPKSGGCRCASANCWFRSNGQVALVRMGWESGYAGYELGLSTGKVVV